MTEYIPAFLDDSLDGRISQARIEYLRSRRQSKLKYRSALNFHNKMLNKQLKPSDKNIMKWDRAIIMIRAYRRNHYLEWIKHEEVQP